MLSKIKNNKGFTIIEIMIVLAIAGLILLIVFLAVPALQRNARNTQRKNDVSNIIAGINTATSNNNGQLPQGLSGSGTLDWLDGSGNTLAESKVGYYTGPSVTSSPKPSDVFFDNADSGKSVGFTGTITSNDDYVWIIPGDTCNGSNAVGGASRGVAVLYVIETTSSAFTAECQGS